MPEVEIKQRYDPETHQWVSWFVCPLQAKGKIKCDHDGMPIKVGYRVWLNFDNGNRYCELHKDEARTDFVQTIKEGGKKEDG